MIVEQQNAFVIVLFLMGTMCDAKKLLWFPLRNLQSTQGQSNVPVLVRGQVTDY